MWFDLLSDPSDATVRPLAGARIRADRTAAERLIEESYQTIFSALAKLCRGNADLAGDLTQETYRRAWQAIDSFDGRAKFSTWLYRIAYTTFLNHIRTPDRTVDMESAPPLRLVDRAAPVQTRLEEEEEAEKLRAAVLRLPEELQYTVTAHFWAEASIGDIAKSEGVTAAAIRKRIRKALALLEEELHDS